VSAVDWSAFQKCGHCFAELGQPCLSLSGVGPAGRVAVAAPAPHGGRKLRAGTVSRG
jgi:hypothetical protein